MRAEFASDELASANAARLARLEKENAALKQQVATLKSLLEAKSS